MRVIGILGGMGPQATIDLYQKVLNFTSATRDQDHLQVLIWSDPHIPDRTAAILHGGADPSDALARGAAKLVQAGAECIGMPCNTAHYFLEAVRSGARGVPVLDMIELTAMAANERLGAHAAVAVTATEATIATQLYERALVARGLRPIVPADGEQDTINDLIFGPKGVKAGFVDDDNRLRYQAVCLRLMQSGAQGVIAACTELPLLAEPASSLLPVIDPTAILAKALVSFGRS